MSRVAVIGAGLSGLLLARRLGGVADVHVFEKSRGAGGRIATRYADRYEFDHGAQFITARTPAFRRLLDTLTEDGATAIWTARFAEIDRNRITRSRQWDEDYPHYVGAPRMNEIGKYLARDVDVRLETGIRTIRRKNRQWTLIDDRGQAFDGFDWLVLAAPAAQTAALAVDYPALVALCDARRLSACFALMLGFAHALDPGFDAALVRNADVSWIAVNSSKPGRNGAFALVVHSTNRWADAHLDADRDRVIDHLLSEASRACGKDLRAATHRQLHRWRYANIAAQDGPECFVDADAGLAACGDWFIRGRIEAAFQSASSLVSELEKKLA